jgi:hypothetical protein
VADFWIKIEKSTPDKPEIFEIANELDLDPDAVLGKLIRVWVWMDSNSESGHIKSVTAFLIDRVSGHKGFADAMKKYGWLDDDHIPNFDRHMGESAKKRAKDSERKRKSRNVTSLSDKDPQNVREVSGNIVTKSGLDKSREDKSISLVVAKAPTPKKYDDDDLKFSEWAWSVMAHALDNPKKPNLESWAKDVRLMRTADGRSYDDLSKIWQWVRKDNFWKSNVMSMKKFREKFDTLNEQSKRPANTGNGYLTANEKAAARAAQTGKLESAQDLEF